MCLLFAEIGALVFGIITLVTGRFQLTRSKVVRGAPATVVGILLIMPLPVAFVVGLVVGAMLAAQGKAFGVGDVPQWVVVLELGIFLFFLVTAFVVAAVSIQPAKKKRLHEDEYDMDDDYEDDRFRRWPGTPDDKDDRPDSRSPDDPTRR